MESKDSLTPAGVTSEEERLYRLLLRRARATPAELARDVTLTPSRTRRVLTSLEEKGLVSRAAGTRATFIPAPPDVAVEALIHRRYEELQRSRLVARGLVDEFRSAARASHPSEIVEVIVGREALVQRFTQLQGVAEEELLAFDKPPYALPPGENREEDVSLRRGVRYRVIYDRAAVEFPGMLDDIRRCVEQGEEARVLTELPMKLDIADRQLALVPLSMDEPGEGGLLIHPSPLLEALAGLFETLWERAVPIGSGTDGSPWESPNLDEADQQILALLAAGSKDEAIARQLGVAPRTVHRRISRLLRILGARTRYQAGLQAARRGWS